VAEKRSVVVVGAGRGLGFALGKAFGAKGWRVALVARRKTELSHLCFELKKLGWDATPYACDTAEEGQVQKVFDYIRHDLKDIDVVHYGPALPRSLTRFTASAATPKAVTEAWRTTVLGAVHCVRAVLPGMLERKSGAFVFTSCAAAVQPDAGFAPAGIAMSGLRSYALSLHAELAPQGVYAAHVAVGVEIKPGGEGDPDRLAAGYVSLIEGRQLPEVVIAPQAGGAPVAAPPPKD
jgi:NAD(P)-dependent dehydrogenase (short-subunit alcohol dehydrogenase family)